MPVLQDFRISKKISVKEYPGSEIEIYNSLLAKDGDILTDLEDNKNISRLIKALTKFIKSWNFTDENNKPLEISVDTINLFSLDAIAEIAIEIKNFSEELKKK